MARDRKIAWVNQAMEKMFERTNDDLARQTALAGKMMDEAERANAANCRKDVRYNEGGASSCHEADQHAVYAASQ